MGQGCHPLLFHVRLEVVLVLSQSAPCQAMQKKSCKHQAQARVRVATLYCRCQEHHLRPEPFDVNTNRVVSINSAAITSAAYELPEIRTLRYKT